MIISLEIHGQLVRRLLLLCLSLVLWLSAMAPPADAGLKHLLIGPFGTLVQPSFKAANGLAVDASTGDLLVIDAQAETISRYHADGTNAPFSALGVNVIDGKGGGECPTVPSDCDQTPQNEFNFRSFPGEAQISVDNSGTSTDGDIYLTQGFVGPVHLVDIFSPSGKYLGQLTAAGTTPFVKNPETEFSPCGVAVDNAGSVYVANSANDRIFKFEPSGNPPVNTDFVDAFSVPKPCSIAAGLKSSAGSLFADSFFTFQNNSVLKVNSVTGAMDYVVDPLEDRLVAVDPTTGHLFASSHERPGEFVAREFDVSGVNPQLVSSFDVKSETLGLAANNEHVYLSQGNKVFEYGPPVIVPDVETGPTSITGNTSVTVEGTVNPGGVPLLECTFEYGTTQAYGSSAPCSKSVLEIGSGSEPVDVHADLSGLAPETVYHYRLVAANENAPTLGEDRTFSTPAKPEVAEEQATGITEVAATLLGKVNPRNALTTVMFEWGPTESYGNTSPMTTIDAEGKTLDDDVAHLVRFDLSSLDPGTVYHWRIVAGNSLGSVPGPDRTFTTYLPLPEGLPDGRVYELVSPALKESADFAIPKAPGGASSASVQPLQASPAGNGISYPSFTATGEGTQGAPATSQYLSTRSESGWGTKNITPRSEEGDLRDPVVGLSSDLAKSVLFVREPPLTEDASKIFKNLYLMENSTGDLQVLTPEPPTPVISVPSAEYCLIFGGASANFEKVVFAARGALRPGDPVGDGFNLYQWSAGLGLELISRLPGAGKAPATPALGTGFGSMSGDVQCNPSRKTLRHAVSADGSRVFWTYEGTLLGAKNPLFAHLDGPGGGETIRLDAPGVGGVAPGGEGKFWDASSDGSKVFFTDAQKLTKNSTAVPGTPDLYRYDFDAPAGSRLTDLSVDTSEPAGVTGVVGVSEDGAYVYFTADGVLTEESNPEGASAKAGQNNLYVWHEGSLKFVGFASQFASAGDLTEQAARLTPDGTHLAFTSRIGLTGFDNTLVGSKGCDLSGGGVDVGGGKDPRC